MSTPLESTLPKEFDRVADEARLQSISDVQKVENTVSGKSSWLVVILLLILSVVFVLATRKSTSS